jgi:pyridoxine 5-phosphate synthase
LDAEQFGAEGITVHPRPDERHIRYADVRALKKVLTTEFNIEGNCREEKFVQLVLEVKPDQVTLVPDAEGQLTSDHGWDTVKHRDYLSEMIGIFKSAGIRTSIFCDPDPAMIAGAALTGTDRIELYTESYAHHYKSDRTSAIAPYVAAAETAKSLGLGINAGHDLNRDNLADFLRGVPGVAEVSIGHAIAADALEFGMAETVRAYQRCIRLAQAPAK